MNYLDLPPEERPELETRERRPGKLEVQCPGCGEWRPGFTIELGEAGWRGDCCRSRELRIEPAVETIEQARERVKAQIRARYQEALNGGYLSPIGPIETGIEQRLKINASVTLAILAGMNQQSFAIDWPVVGSAEPVALDVSGMALFGVDVAGWAGALDARQNELLLAADQAVDAEALELVQADISTGWPA